MEGPGHHPPPAQSLSTAPQPLALRGSPSTSSSGAAATSTNRTSRRQVSLTNIVIPPVAPFRTHRADSAASSTASPNSIKRKPVGSGASPHQKTQSGDSIGKSGFIATRNGQRSSSLSHTLDAETTYTNGLSPLKSATSDDIVPRNLDE